MKNYHGFFYFKENPKKENLKYFDKIKSRYIY